jgi:hypothetical protein
MGLRCLRSTVGCGYRIFSGRGNIQMRTFGIVVRCAVLVAAATSLSACAGGMIPGQIYSEQGKVLEFQIEKARRTGAVAAFDPQTGEHYAGNYVGILEAVGGSSVTVSSAGNVGATSFGLGSNIANATAYLTGDKGSMLNCEMKIEASISPHGIGGCTDQRGGKYRLQF